MVHVLDLRFQGSMAHQVSLPHSEHMSFVLRLGIGLITPLPTVLPNLGASSTVRILPYAYMHMRSIILSARLPDLYSASQG